MRRILKYIILIIPILLIGTGTQASGYRLEFPTMSRDTIIDTDSLSFEGTEVLKVKKDRGPHSAKKATYMAMILPGSGQVYNGQWWKLPILYGGIGATVYGLTWNMKYFKKYRTAFVDYTEYINKKEEDPDTPYPTNPSWDKLMMPGRNASDFNASQRKRLQEQLKTKKDNYKRNRDLLYIVSGAIYVIQIIDATVFAHFYDFEIDDNLSMNVRPSTGFTPVSGGTVGLTLTFNF